MTATDVIEQIRSLNPDERARVMDFVRQLSAESSEDNRDAKTVRFATSAQAQAGGDKVVQQYDEVFRRLSK